jgi:hypothetical protein
MTFTLPAGTSYFSLTYRRSTLETVSDSISFVAWFFLIITYLKDCYYNIFQHHPVDK